MCHSDYERADSFFVSALREKTVVINFENAFRIGFSRNFQLSETISDISRTLLGIASNLKL